MSPREENIEKINRRIRQIFRQELVTESKPKRIGLSTYRWLLMLYWKFLKDDVKVRAESLAFLMIFSFLPLFAGVFFIFTLFTKFGMVQEAIGGFFDNILTTFPEEHRVMLQDFALNFTDNYLERITNTSSSVGIFAILILIWIGHQTYDNIDRTLNFIWSSERSRPALEKLRNLIVVAFVAPLVLIASLSVPLILMKIDATRLLFESLPLLKNLINVVTPLILMLLTLFVLYRYGPVQRVPWQAALGGAFFAALALLGANWFMNIYFRFGTHTIYGKAAVIPLFCFWIYVVWIVIILGAELSYLIQNKRYITQSGERTPTIYEIECLLAILLYVYQSHRRGKTPVTFDELFEHTRLEGGSLRSLLNYLETKHLLLRTAPNSHSSDAEYTLARDVGPMSIGELMSVYVIENLPKISDSQLGVIFHESFHKWIEGFNDKTIAAYADSNLEKKAI